MTTSDNTVYLVPFRFTQMLVSLRTSDIRICHSQFKKYFIIIVIYKTMKKRYVYSLLYGIPGLIISFLVATFVTGMTMGIFWLFMFGDTMEWPSWTEWVAPTLGIIAFVIMQSIIVIIGFNVGKKQEANDLPINRKYIIIPMLIIVFFIFYVMIIFRNSDDVCSNLCIKKGYDKNNPVSTSEYLGKKSCSCWNNTTETWDKEFEIE